MKVKEAKMRLEYPKEQQCLREEATKKEIEAANYTSKRGLANI